MNSNEGSAVQVYVRPGTYFRTRMPYSEVCMHMKIAGKVMLCQFHPNSRSIQLYEDDLLCSNPAELRPFSAPILPGEAGVYQDSEGYYIYRPLILTSKLEVGYVS